MKPMILGWTCALGCPSKNQTSTMKKYIWVMILLFLDEDQVEASEAKEVEDKSVAVETEMEEGGIEEEEDKEEPGSNL